MGTTTGRGRRCGWLDLVVLKHVHRFVSLSAFSAPSDPFCMYSTMINGYTRLNITKLDVLTGIPEIKVAVACASTPPSLVFISPRHVTSHFAVIKSAASQSLPCPHLCLFSPVLKLSMPLFQAGQSPWHLARFVGMLLLPLMPRSHLCAADVCRTSKDRSGLRHVVRYFNCICFIVLVHFIWLLSWHFPFPSPHPISIENFIKVPVQCVPFCCRPCFHHELNCFSGM